MTKFLALDRWPLSIELFGHLSNAINFVNWGFVPVKDPLTLTAKTLSRVCDVRLPLMCDEAKLAVGVGDQN